MRNERDKARAAEETVMKNPGKERIEELTRQIEDLKRRWPAHSVPAAMMEQLDALEEEQRIEVERGSEAAEGRDESA